MAASDREHWDRIYATKKATEVSWYRPHLDASLSLIDKAAADRNSAIIDVGGGESTFVDDLIARGYTDLTVLDISNAALEATRNRLRGGTERVQWICGDVTSTELPEARYDVWHDRAVFHFLTDPARRAAYVNQVARCLRDGGHLIVGTFGPGGPPQCSGLDVVRYDANALQQQFGAHFELIRHLEEVHATPLGREQPFVWCLFRMIGKAT